MRTSPTRLIFWMAAVTCIIHFPMAYAELERHQVQEILVHRTFQFSRDRESYIKQSNFHFFQSAVDRAANDISNAPQPEQSVLLDKASRNIGLFIDIMSQEAQGIQKTQISDIPKQQAQRIQTPQTRGNPLGERTLHRAKTTLCPLWPLCL